MGPLYSLDRVKAIYTAIWKAAEARGIFVRYEALESGSEGGRFQVEGTHRQIWIGRECYAEAKNPHWYRTDGSPVDLVRELMILSHEDGHERAFAARPPNFEQAANAYRRAQVECMPADPDLYRIVFAEEVSAWEHAKRTLESHGWGDWESFEAVKAQCLATYTNTPRAGGPWVVRRESDGRIEGRFDEGDLKKAIAWAHKRSCEQEATRFLVRYEPSQPAGTYYFARACYAYELTADGGEHMIDLETLERRVTEDD